MSKVTIGIIFANILFTSVCSSSVSNKLSPFSIDRLAEDSSSLGTSAQKTSLSDTAISIASGQATNTLQELLNQFGTAQVDLRIDKHFSLKDSSIDVLFPLVNGKDNVLFTQFGMRDNNRLFTTNFGLGHRYFTENWMFGYNVFYDTTWNNVNKRLGIGGEVWRDYLKLSVNGYTRISGWRQSKQHEDFNERPANGWDIQAEGWLQQYPALGGKLMYEQYEGNNVSLFGHKNLQHNPSAVTLGMNYTPIPLITIGLDHKQGQKGNNDTRLQLKMNLQLGVPWKNQTDPNAVSNMRSLAKSRYDLVNRNNNIVLEYQKQELIKLTLPEKIIGKAGENTVLTALVTSKHSVERIEWNINELLAAGGKASHASPTTLAITYPPYQAGQLNMYHISAVAYDTQGNQSSRETMLIEVTEPGEVIITSELTVISDNATADGIETNEVKIKVIYSNGNPLANQEVRFTANNGAKVTATSVLTNQDGVASTTLTNKKPGVAQVTATINGNTVSVDTYFAKRIATTTLTIDAEYIDVGVASTLTAKLRDSNNNPIANADIVFTTTGSATLNGVAKTYTATTDEDGNVAIPLMDYIEERVTVTARAIGYESDEGAAVTIYFYTVSIPEA